MQNFSSYKTDLKRLIAIKSVREKPIAGAPFGNAVHDALSLFLSIAKDMGFQTINYDGYIGEVILGEGEEIGIIGHLDVVPTGIGWDTDPFTLTEKNGALFGRGVQDDKAPLLSCLYALKELKDSNVRLNKKFRLIVGCDEETGWEDIAYMKEKTLLPEFGFSPDGNFPLSYAEKGIVVVTVSIPPLKRFKNLSGGSVINAVCDYACAYAEDDAIDKNLILKHGLILENNLIISKGKAAHGSTPSLGKNALIPLFSYFLDMGEDVKGVLDNLFLKDGIIPNTLTEQGNATFSPDVLREENGEILIDCDCRFPAPLTLETDLLPIFDSFGLKYKAKLKHDTHYVKKDSAFVSTLLSAYNQVTGEKGEPISLGGSTFARAFKMGCSFGPMLGKRHGNIHDANENTLISDLLSAYEIYKKALFALNELK